MPRDRLEDLIRAWRIEVERVHEAGSIVVFGRRDDRDVVLKVMPRPGDEWRVGEALAAFEGRGVVRVIEYVAGAALMERVIPGIALDGRVAAGDDDAATGILAEVIARMSPRTPPSGTPTVAEWGRGFDRFLAAGGAGIGKSLAEEARGTYTRLCATQSKTRLLHGDLHHGNVLLDAGRGWLAIDPKGVVGELEYEVGAALRNPCERPEIFTAPATIERRVDWLVRELALDRDRVLGWAFAQAVLAAIWAVEDETPEPIEAWLALAHHLRPKSRA